MKKSVARRSLDLTSLFEAEVLVQLMLHHWGHPLADDQDFANALLEDASQLLRMAIGGDSGPTEIPPESLSFIAAVWWAERQQVAGGVPQSEKREAWLVAVRRALPSCFCDPEDLVP